ncbi:MAG: hypothetical protein HY822_06055, partial [Acidobacteria bacterium]|nr:hypothetical protein [Acidobacteriota bacterium]
MKRSWVLWLVAFLITAGSAVYQRRTGPTYPVRGRAALAGQAIAYEFMRSHSTGADCAVRIETGDPAVEGVLLWKRHKTRDAWRHVPMAHGAGALSAVLPRQPAAGKLDYSVELRKGAATLALPPSGDIVIRFKGDVPAPVLVVHVIGIFGAMLLSTRAGLEALAGRPALRKHTLWTVGFLLVGGMILGPVVQKYAFGAFWTGWPFGHDLTDNKTAVAFLAWVGAWVASARSRNPRRWMVF